jgi:hypothetical protein
MPNPTSSKEGKIHGPNFWVVRHRGGFSIKKEKTAHVLIPPSSQQLAITIARQLARANMSELIVQGESGRIRLRDSHGFDPFPPKG